MTSVFAVSLVQSVRAVINAVKPRFGVNEPFVPIALRDLPPITVSHAEQILARSRNERSRPREAIEQKLKLFLGQRKLFSDAGGIVKPAKRKRSAWPADDVYR